MGLDVAFFIQMITGTFVGFAFKFIADKYIIFKDKNSNIKHTIVQLFRYTLFAIITTFIFWCTEIGFKFAFSFNGRDLVGGFLGLCLGYTIKFILDKRYVFNSL